MASPTHQQDDHNHGNGHDHTDDNNEGPGEGGAAVGRHGHRLAPRSHKLCPRFRLHHHHLDGKVKLVGVAGVITVRRPALHVVDQGEGEGGLVGRAGYVDQVRLLVLPPGADTACAQLPQCSCRGANLQGGI